MKKMTQCVSLRIKLVGGIELLVLSVALFVYFYFPFRQNSQAFQARKAEAFRLAGVLSRTVATGLEFEDRETVESALAGVKTRADLVHLEVKDDLEAVFYAINKNRGNSLGDPKDVISVDVPVYSGDDEIGSMAIGLSVDDLKKQAAENRRAILLVSLIIIGIGALYGMNLTRLIMRPVARVKEIVQMIAEGEGDLTRRLSVESRDEIGAFAAGFNHFLDNLADLVGRVKAATENVASETEQISSIATELTAGAEEQAVQTSGVASSMQEMTATIFENSKNATQTSKIAEIASQKSREGAETMQATQRGMEEIVQSTAKTGAIIDSLSGRAVQIEHIIQVIDEIADQTNLLALNAAIEAARAGEQGRGFAVVADEVRKLAERTTRATKEIADTIQAIQGDTEEASRAMSEACSVIEKGREAAGKTERVLGEILEAIAGATEMVNQIDQASEHMNLGAEEISKNLEVISTVTNQSASSADRMASSAERLSNQTEALRGLVGRFQLNAPDSHESADVGDEKPRYHIPGMCHPERMEVEIQNS